MAFAPDVRLDMPGMLYPGRKPAGRSKLDRTNPLADNLLFFGVVEPNGVLHELVQEYVVSSVNPTFTEASVDGNGHCCRSLDVASGEGVEMAIRPITLNPSYSMLIVYKQLSTLSQEQPAVTFAGDVNYQGTLRFYWDWGSQVPVFEIAQDSGYRSVVYSYWDYTSPNIPVNTHMSTVYTILSDEDVFGYSNGNLLLEVPDPTPIIPPQTFTLLNIGGDVYSGNYSDANVYAVAVFKKPLTEEASRELSKNPYQLLVPNRG